MSRPFVLGLTGSVGTGKTTTAALFADAGVPVWDADAVVHRLYGPGGAGVPVIAELVPEAVGEGVVDRAKLRAAVLSDPGLLQRVEAAIHPLVAADRADFIARQSKAPLIVCDIPLLFETDADADMDAVLVVTAAPEVQRERVLARRGMTDLALDALLARQMSDKDKRARADYVIDTGSGIEAARESVRALVSELTGG
jgi:dephospho-CoA kinase